MAAIGTAGAAATTSPEHFVTRLDGDLADVLDRRRRRLAGGRAPRPARGHARDRVDGLAVGGCPVNRRRITLSELVLLAALAVVSGFVYWALVQAWIALQIAMGPFGDLAQHVLIGGWMVAAPLALYIVRRPGVGIVVELAAALVEVVFLASPVGPMLLVVGSGAGRRRRGGVRPDPVPPVRLGRLRPSGALAGLASTVLGMVRFGWLTQDWFAWRLGPPGGQRDPAVRRRGEADRRRPRPHGRARQHAAGPRPPRDVRPRHRAGAGRMIEVRGLGVAFPGAASPVLRAVDLDVGAR